MTAGSEVRKIIAELRALGSAENRAGMARFGIDTKRAFGVSMATMQPLAKPYRRRHDIAVALWDSGFHEARIFAAIIEDPEQVTPGQMEAWAQDFDSWDICDQTCSRVFAQTPHVDAKIRKWAKDEREFVRRAAFASIAAVCVYARDEPDATFLAYLKLVETHAGDDRNFVRKAVNWALRQIGKRSPSLSVKAVALAEKLASADDKTRRWIGKDALRELTDPKQVARIAARAEKSGKRA